MPQEFSHCDYNCEYVEPYGFVPEAGCPIHCPEEYIDEQPYTIETCHILDAIPGDTNRQKLAWVQQAKAGIYACGCGGNCDKGADAAEKAMAKALGEIEAVVEKYKLYHGNKVTPMERIAEIVGRVE